MPLLLVINSNLSSTSHRSATIHSLRTDRRADDGRQPYHELHRYVLWSAKNCHTFFSSS